MPEKLEKSSKETKAPPAKAGVVRLVAPAGVTHCSFDGEAYAVENGTVDVPPLAVAALLEHGFTRAAE